MRSKGPLLAGDAKGFHAPLHFRGKFGEIRRGGDPGPEDARMALVGKEADIAKTQFHRLIRANGGELGLDAPNSFRRDLANEFQRHVHTFHVCPAGAPAIFFQLADKTADRLPHLVRNFQRYKNSQLCSFNS